MTRFRKKPVEVYARQFDGSWESARALLEWMQGVDASWCDNGTLVIATLEGEMTASAGDWIIRGVKAEFYPCKPDIFTATYEPAQGIEARSDETRSGSARLGESPVGAADAPEAPPLLGESPTPKGTAE